MNKVEFQKLVDDKLDLLTVMLKAQEHLDNPDKVLECIEGISKFYSSLKSEDREYLQFARQALKDRLPWQS